MHRRKGTTVLEVAAAMTVAAVAIALASQWFIAATRQQRMLDRKDAALIAAANAAERIRAAAPTDLTDAWLAGLAISPAMAASLSDARLLAVRDDDPEDTSSMRVAIEVYDHSSEAEPVRFARLVVWKQIPHEVSSP